MNGDESRRSHRTSETVMGNRPNTRTWKSMLNTNPPFRADHVGSILRSAPLKDARAKREKGEITAAQLKAVEDTEIKKIIAKQEEIGLQLATDGEYRRSTKERELAKQRGDDPTRLPEIYARVINEAIRDRPSDMVITTHVCRGNFRSTWISEGGYEPVAEVLFGKVNYDGYFLEYDTERAGGFEPLRFVPKGKKQIVLGLVTSKSGTLEKKDDIKKRIDEATKYVALDQLCLSPQCGFASTEEGNVLTDEAQSNKMRMIR